MVYVISGGPGFGKSSLIDELKSRGYRVSGEIAREILFQHNNRSNHPEKIQYPKDFERLVARERVRFLEELESESIAFSDRGLPDQIAYSWYKSKEPSLFLNEIVVQHRYAPLTFITPPWELIYKTDEIRKETFEEACRIHQFILDAYIQTGYRLVNLPCVSISDRADFILKWLQI